MWSTKHKPKKKEDISLNRKALDEIINNLMNAPILVYGHIGSGKSTIIEVAAAELDCEVVEITDDNIDNAVSISQTASLSGRKKLIYLNNPQEIKKIKEVGRLIKETKNPLILESSDASHKRLRTLKKKCAQVNIRKPTSASVAKLLDEICVRENVKADKILLREIADNAGGDIRSAVIDLETIAKGRKEIKKEHLSILESRDRSVDIYNTLSRILVKKDFDDAVKSTWNLDLQPRDTLLWIDENIPRVYRDKTDIYRAFYYLSRADSYIGRIYERQYWGLLRYATPLMTGGVNIAKRNKIKPSFFQFPRYIIELSKTKKERGLKKSIGSKLSLKLHASNKIIAQQYIRLYRTLLGEKIVSPDILQKKYRLSSDEIEYLLG